MFRQRTDHDAGKSIARRSFTLQFGALRRNPARGLSATRGRTTIRQNREGPMQYDLLLTGGEVIDPGAGLRGVMDVGIAGGKIAAVAPSLPTSQAHRSISVKGKIL